MVIKWLGHSSFLIENNYRLVIDPFDPSINTLPSGLTADIVAITHDHFDHNYVSGVENVRQIINSAGEYDIRGFHIRGVNSFHDSDQGARRGGNIIYTIETEGTKVCHLGDLGQILNEEQLDAIGQVDVLMIPVGGFYTISVSDAVAVVTQIKPKLVVPMHYQVPGFTPAKLQITSADGFIDILNWPVETRQSLILTPATLTTQKVIRLELTKSI
jgi:L-ascorbate metabolism protein UlaG (beta-lactamase superfamily)